MTTGEKKEEENEIKRSGRRTLIIPFRQRVAQLVAMIVNILDFSHRDVLENT
jgi:hypothetical protein